MIASKEEAERVVVDLRSAADKLPQTRQGVRAAQNLHNAASTVALLYGLDP